MKPKQDYSLLDRSLHRLAFSARTIQLAAADMEQTMFGSQYRDIEIHKPVFITSLPRAGTTLMLELLSRFPGVATHRYRDMPFIMAPMLWQRISQGFRKESRLKERAHGDGMQVGYDSPEAFEEVIWHSFWPDKYRADGIATWSEQDSAVDFHEFLTAHMQKIIALRLPENPGDGRYISKNNANIARIPLLEKLYPDACIIIPFRHPLNHAASMLRQHRNFLRRHREDPFSRKYMQDIGHFEFGQLHRPIRFQGSPSGDADNLDYWLRYWVAAFSCILNEHNRVQLVSFERLCAGGVPALANVAEHLGIDPAAANEQAAIFHAPPDYQSDVQISEPGLLESAQALHEQLLAASIL